MDREKVRRELMWDDSANTRRRRAVVALSLFGIALAAFSASRQTGLVKHLPDPPGNAWDTDRVNSSDEAYPFAIPDAPIALVSLAGNVLAASVGDAARSRTTRCVPILAAGKGVLDALVAARSLYAMKTRIKAWCPTCVLTAFADFAIAGLLIPEAVEAIRGGRTGVGVGHA